MVVASEQLPAGAVRHQNELFKLQTMKTKLCKFYAMNQCRYGDQCGFAHGSEKLEQKPDLRKTSICKEWKQGTCPLRSIDCLFAHGRSELRRTDVYMQKANGFQENNPFDNTDSNGSGNQNFLDNTRLEANRFGDHSMSNHTNLDHKWFNNDTKLDLDRCDELSEASTDEGDEIPSKVGTMDSITSISTCGSSAFSINMEPVKVATPPSLQCFRGPSVILNNLPLKYSKEMLTNEIMDLGFVIPRDIAYIHLPIAANTFLNYGHCLIVFNGTHAVNAFIDVFHGKVMNRFKTEMKVVNVAADFSDDMEVTWLSEAGLDRLVWEQNPEARPAECKACTGCGHINMIIGHRFCQWCGSSYSDASSSVARI